MCTDADHSAIHAGALTPAASRGSARGAGAGAHRQGYPVRVLSAMLCEMRLRAPGRGGRRARLLDDPSLQPVPRERECSCVAIGWPRRPVHASSTLPACGASRCLAGAFQHRESRILKRHLPVMHRVRMRVLDAPRDLRRGASLGGGRDVIPEVDRRSPAPCACVEFLQSRRIAPRNCVPHLLCSYRNRPSTLDRRIILRLAGYGALCRGL